MCHLEALSGEPSFDPAQALAWVMERAGQN
jgi:predicted TIM-barrel enzyme